jgi:hypothetical protein
MDNVIVNRPNKIDEDIEGFKIDAVDDEKNFTVSRIKLCRDPEFDKPIEFYTQELIRNFRNPTDPFNKRHIIKAFTPSNITAAAGVTLERKFFDTVLAHKTQIDDYSPLTDIHSHKMNLYLDDETATFLSDLGVNVDGMGEDFQSIESVSATPFMENIAHDARKLKSELNELRKSYMVLKEQMADEFSEYVDPNVMSDEEFSENLAHEKVSEALVKCYLSLTEKITRLESQLGQVNSTVFMETSSKIKLPGSMKETSHELFPL